MSPGKRKQIDPIEKAVEAALFYSRLLSGNVAWLFVEDFQGVADEIGKLVRKEFELAASQYGIFIQACHENVIALI